MKIAYCVTAKGNPLYNGEFLTYERYKTFGQHSFIIDFIAAAKRNHCTIDLLIEGKESFPFQQCMQDICNVHEFSEANSALCNADIAILDELSSEAIENIPANVYAFGLVHDAGKKLPAKKLEACNRIVCMTETAINFQRRYIDYEKLLLFPQAVDVERFTVAGLPYNEKIRVLLFTRLVQQKRATLLGILDELLKQPELYDITVLGDGELFWEICNTYGQRITVVNHIPCISIHRFLREFDVVISSARGVMEACASGIPALCAGLGYAGVVTHERIPTLIKRNLTGYGEAIPVRNIHHHIRQALDRPRSYWRELGLKYFNMEDFVRRILNEVPRRAVNTESGNYKKTSSAQL